MQEGKEVPCCVNEPYILYDVPFFYQSLIHQSPFLTLYGTNDARTHARTPDAHLMGIAIRPYGRILGRK